MLCPVSEQTNPDRHGYDFARTPFPWQPTKATDSAPISRSGSDRQQPGAFPAQAQRPVYTGGLRAWTSKHGVKMPSSPASTKASAATLRNRAASDVPAGARRSRSSARETPAVRARPAGMRASDQRARVAPPRPKFRSPTDAPCRCWHTSSLYGVYQFGNAMLQAFATRFVEFRELSDSFGYLPKEI